MRPRAYSAFALLVLSVSAASPADSEATQFDIAVDEAKVIHLDQPPRSVIIGNPSIADVTLENGRILIVTGKAAGETNLIALDAEGREIAARIIRVGVNSGGIVTVYNGRKRETLYCAPLCESIFSAGDDADHAAARAAATARKLDAGRRAAASGSAER